MIYSCNAKFSAEQNIKSLLSAIGTCFQSRVLNTWF